MVIVLLKKRLYKYQHKKVNKKYFFLLIFIFFSINLRGKGDFGVKKVANQLILNGFQVFYTHSVDALQFFNNSVRIALSY